MGSNPNQRSLFLLVLQPSTKDTAGRKRSLFPCGSDPAEAPGGGLWRRPVDSLQSCNEQPRGAKVEEVTCQNVSQIPTPPPPLEPPSPKRQIKANK